ncbi:putative dehydrogenase subunit [Trichinella pseudospiralis]
MGYCQVGALPRVCLLLQRRAFVGARLSILTLFFPSIEQSQRSANETDLGELCRQMQRRSRQLMKCKRFDTPSRCSKPQLALSCISSTANNKVSKTASRQGLFWNLFLEPEVRFCVFTLYVAFDCVWQVILVKGGGERNEVTKLKVLMETFRIYD